MYCRYQSCIYLYCIIETILLINIDLLSPSPGISPRFNWAYYVYIPFLLAHCECVDVIMSFYIDSFHFCKIFFSFFRKMMSFFLFLLKIDYWAACNTCLQDEKTWKDIPNKTLSYCYHTLIKINCFNVLLNDIQ